MSPLTSILTRVKRRSTMDTHVSLERKETFDLEDGPQSPRTQTFPLLSQLYEEASEYEKILLRSGCMNAEGGCSDQETTAFIKLVGQDLSSCEKALASRNEKVFATNKPWIPGQQVQPDGIIDESEESSVGDSQSSGSGSRSGSGRSSATSGIDSVVPSIHRPVIHDSSEDLEPDEILKLIIEEFGVLAPANDEEKLLLETDGCLIHDVAVVGVIHLTTHRLTFHASLFATRPDIAPGREVLKAGPATFHRKGWRGKRRVWLELLPDMLCAYASSKEEDKWRPISTLLLAHIEGAEPLDPKKPKLIRLKIDPSAQMVNDYSEFDTEESARDWRKELAGALFNYRHLRKEAYSSSSPDSTNGVRLSLPLTQITKLEACANDETFHSVLDLTVKLSASDFLIEKEAVPDTQIFKIGPIQNIPVWQRLGDIIAESKLRQIRNGSIPSLPSPVIVDFGPYNFFESAPNKANSDQEVIENEHAIRTILGFPPENPIWVARARLYRTVTCTGYIVISKDEFGFWSKNITQQDVKYRLPVADVQMVKPFHVNWRNLEGATLKLTNGHEAKFIFKSVAIRDEAVKRLNAVMHPTGSTASGSTASELSVELISSEPSFSTMLEAELTASSPTSITPSTRPTPTRKDTVSVLAPLSRSLAAAIVASTKLPKSATDLIPKAINIPRDTLFTRKALHFVCLTIGSRGDVQPYIALGLGLKKEGHNVTIVTHEEYGDWIRGFGINHRTAGGDPGALMKLSVENKASFMFSPEFFRESLTHFRPWLDQLLIDSWEGCRDADVLLESPSAMAGVHIAEALNIPYFRTFTMPWTKTTEFPHAFLSTSVESPTFNAASYVLYGNVIWAATSNQINRWRRNLLKLENTDMGHLAQSKITFIYNFSKAVVPKPLDWPDTTIVSGYWFLDNPEMSWTPPDELTAFMVKARADGKPIVYIGFGSVTVPRPNKVTNAIVKAVLLSDVRAIVSKGWSARMQKGEDKDPEPVIPPECFMLDRVPHDWLFPRVDAALHHGGAGTTGASLRAGIPTLIKPWFGDQYFWASRVQKLGAGLRVPSLHASDLSDALIKATRSEVMKAKAASVGEQIRQENGVHTSIHAIYTYLHRAGQDRTSLV
ncbi:hypothetical protein D9619_007125 [Psilocybe cf. subviscida]|uniref:sterol 3beta-glucosyltransferase n=1 Tax=Psilocybe cf. subviscida TaxID=2480587 RepID=A0A8H5EWK9_9AGAR|nr:hypothetical protein D9619_007125 [Psilocybe cf. subviscida]